VVVGGGPAGMEAARVAAIKGHEVVLFEEQPRIGGQLNLWAALPGPRGLWHDSSLVERRSRKWGVSVRTGVRADAV